MTEGRPGDLGIELSATHAEGFGRALSADIRQTAVVEIGSLVAAVAFCLFPVIVRVTASASYQDSVVREWEPFALEPKAALVLVVGLAGIAQLLRWSRDDLVSMYDRVDHETQCQLLARQHLANLLAAVLALTAIFGAVLGASYTLRNFSEENLLTSLFTLSAAALLAAALQWTALVPQTIRAHERRRLLSARLQRVENASRSWANAGTTPVSWLRLGVFAAAAPVGALIATGGSVTLPRFLPLVVICAVMSPVLSAGEGFARWLSAGNRPAGWIVRAQYLVLVLTVLFTPVTLAQSSGRLAAAALWGTAVGCLLRRQWTDSRLRATLGPERRLLDRLVQRDLVSLQKQLRNLDLDYRRSVSGGRH